mmetsp:Transcript_14007/g.13825  ORF Transcript_14007/g.13825 Transcript_14007/m.13825 type:complete len:231 (+) Transcript_14007:112-804(+)
MTLFVLLILYYIAYERAIVHLFFSQDRSFCVLNDSRCVAVFLRPIFLSFSASCYNAPHIHFCSSHDKIMTQSEHTFLSSDQDKRKNKGLISSTFSIFVLVLTIFCAVRFTTNYINDSVNVTTTTDTNTDTGMALMLMDSVLDEKDEVVIKEEEKDRSRLRVAGSKNGVKATCPQGCTFYYFGCGIGGNPSTCPKCQVYYEGPVTTGERALCASAIAFGSPVFLFTAACCK